MNHVRRRRTLAPTLVAAFAVVGFAASASADNHRVTFCHATGSERSPYVNITTSINAFVNAGHDDPEGLYDIFGTISVTVIEAAGFDITVTLDGEVVDPADYESIEVDVPGKHTVVISFEGDDASEPVELTHDFAACPEPSPSPSVSPSPSPSTSVVGQGPDELPRTGSSVGGLIAGMVLLLGAEPVSSSWRAGA